VDRFVRLAGAHGVLAAQIEVHDQEQLPRDPWLVVIFLGLAHAEVAADHGELVVVRPLAVRPGHRDQPLRRHDVHAVDQHRRALGQHNHTRDVVVDACKAMPPACVNPLGPGPRDLVRWHRVHA
jgi:hypothetical protein